jgi:hypothetical protein
LLRPLGEHALERDEQDTEQRDVDQEPVEAEIIVGGDDADFLRALAAEQRR